MPKDASLISSAPRHHFWLITLPADKLDSFQYRLILPSGSLNGCYSLPTNRLKDKNGPLCFKYKFRRSQVETSLELNCHVSTLETNIFFLKIHSLVLSLQVLQPVPTCLGIKPHFYFFSSRGILVVQSSQHTLYTGPQIACCPWASVSAPPDGFIPIPGPWLLHQGIFTAFDSFTSITS